MRFRSSAATTIAPSSRRRGESSASCSFSLTRTDWWPAVTDRRPTLAASSVRRQRESSSAVSTEGMRNSMSPVPLLCLATLGRQNVNRAVSVSRRPGHRDEMPPPTRSMYSSSARFEAFNCSVMVSLTGGSHRIEQPVARHLGGAGRLAVHGVHELATDAQLEADRQHVRGPELNVFSASTPARVPASRGLADDSYSLSMYT